MVRSVSWTFGSTNFNVTVFPSNWSINVTPWDLNDLASRVPYPQSWRCCSLVGENACMAWTSMVWRTWSKELMQERKTRSLDVQGWQATGKGSELIPCRVAMLGLAIVMGHCWAKMSWNLGFKIAWALGLTKRFKEIKIKIKIKIKHNNNTNKQQLRHNI